MLVGGLKHNLLSKSQLCDKVTFDNYSCTIENIKDNKVLFIGLRVENVYIFKLDNVAALDETSLASMSDNSWLWHRTLVHTHMDLISKLSKNKLVIGLPKMSLRSMSTSKQTKISFKFKNIIST